MSHADSLSPRRRGALLIALLCVLLASLYAIGGPLRVPVHFLLAQFCHGVSAGKIGFLLLYVIAISTRVALCAPRPRATLRIDRLMLWIPILLGLAGAMASYFIYTTRLSLPTNTPTFHWLDGLNSVNSFAHTHTSKAVIALSLDAIGLKSVTHRFDTGAPYAAIIPVWLSIAIGLCFLASLVQTIRIAPMVVARYPSEQRTGVTLLYALTGSACVKCILDGGPAAYDCICAVLTLALLMRSLSLEGLCTTARRHALLIVAGIGSWLCVVGLVSFPALSHQAEHFFYRLLLHSLIVSSTLWLAGKSHARIAAARRATVASAALAALFCYEQATTWLIPLYRSAPARAVVFADSNPAPSPTPIAGATYERAYRALGDSPTRVRRVCFPQSTQPTGFFAQLVPLSHDTPNALLPALQPSSVVTLPRSERSPDGPANAYNIQVTFPGPGAPALCPLNDRPLCVLDENERFVAYHLFDNALRNAGLSEYVLIPYGLYADRPNQPRHALAE